MPVGNCVFIMLRGNEIRTVRPDFVSMLARIIVSVRTPVRSYQLLMAHWRRNISEGVSS